MKLKELKRPLRKMNSKYYAHISSRIKQVENELQMKQLQLHRQIGNPALQHEVIELKKIEEEGFSSKESEMSLLPIKSEMQIHKEWRQMHQILP